MENKKGKKLWRNEGRKIKMKQGGGALPALHYLIFEKFYDINFYHMTLKSYIYDTLSHMEVENNCK